MLLHQKVLFLFSTGNGLLKTVKTLLAITQFTQLKPATILESGLVCEYLLECLQNHLRCKAGSRTTKIKKNVSSKFEISLST